MQVEQLFQTTDRDAIYITVISMHQWQNPDIDLDMNWLHAQQFKARCGDLAYRYTAEGQIAHVYLGAGDNLFGEALAQAALKLAEGVYRLSHEIPVEAHLAWALAQYQFDRYKKSQTQPRILCVSHDTLAVILPLAKSIYLARDLINRPANDLGPQGLSDAFLALANAHEATVDSWVGEVLLTANYPAIHAVGRAAIEPPRLLSLTWGNPAHPKVTLVGKGVCFDSGGLDIKPSSAMRLMKKDMGGAAIVMGIAEWVMSVGLPIRLQVLIPAVENAVGSDSYRPGDILTMRNGLTVEVDNTDAEGRLVLADALVKACEASPELLIDFSTLTGAARVAVGTEISALFCNDDVLAHDLYQAGLTTKDMIWRLPLFKGYQNMLDSRVADMVNSPSSSYAGAIAAALFLERFIKPGISWAHFDTMAWNVSNKPGKPEGGEAMGLLAVCHYLQEKFAQIAPLTLHSG